jgi:hypothetical protein
VRFGVLLPLMLAGCFGGTPCRDGVSRKVWKVLGPLTIGAWDPYVCAHPNPLYYSLRGRAVASEPLGFAPVPYTRMLVLRGARVVATAATDRDGRFTFTDDIPSGIYDVVLDSDAYEGRTRVLVDCGSRNIVMTARFKSP